MLSVAVVTPNSFFRPKVLPKTAIIIRASLTRMDEILDHSMFIHLIHSRYLNISFIVPQPVKFFFRRPVPPSSHCSKKHSPLPFWNSSEPLCFVLHVVPASSQPSHDFLSFWLWCDVFSTVFVLFLRICQCFNSLSFVVPTPPCA